MQVVRVKTHGRADETGPLMRRMVDMYYRDMLPYSSMPLGEAFDAIKSVPYRRDPPDEETLMRPRFTMQGTGWGGDCDDKCIALASYAKLRGLPIRFIALRRPGYPLLHHVACEIFIRTKSNPSGMWIHADPTYPFNVLGLTRGRYVERVVI